MHKKPLITTIIPTYKRPHLLKRAIKSVLNQSFEDIQICVYDNASKDGTEAVVKDFAAKDPRVKYHCHEKTIRPVDNFQYGLDRVNTPYFSFLSDDDLLMPNFYEDAMNVVKKHEVAFFVGNLFAFNQKHRVIDIIFRAHVEEGIYYPEKTIETFVGKRFFVWTSVLFNTEKAKTIGKIDDTMIISDGDYLLKLMYRYPIYVSRKIVAAFFINPQGMSNKMQIKFVWPAMKKIIESLNKVPKIAENIKKPAHGRLLDYAENYLYSMALKDINNCDYEIVWKIIDILKNEIHKEEKAFDIYVNMAKKMAFQNNKSLFDIKQLLQSYFQGNVESHKVIKRIGLHRFYLYHHSAKIVSKILHYGVLFKFYTKHRKIYFKYFWERKKANKIFSNLLEKLS